MATRARSSRSTRDTETPDQTPESTEPTPEPTEEHGESTNGVAANLDTEEVTENEGEVISPSPIYQVVESEIPISAARTLVHDVVKPNPLKGVVKASFESGKARQIAVKDGEEAKTVTTLLRKDAVKSGLGVAVQPILTEDKTVTHVVFQGKARNKRAYSNDDIKSWAGDQGLAITGGGKNGKAIPKETRDAFKKAHGYTKDES